MSLLNQLYTSYLRFARPTDKKRTLSSVDRDNALLSSLIPDAIANGSYYRLTADRLVSIITEADQGDPRIQAALFSQMQEKEPLYAAHLQTRRLAVLACDWEIRSNRHKNEAAGIEEMLHRAGLRKAIGHLLDCIGTGYAGIAVDWSQGASSVRGFSPIMPDAWTFDEGGFPALNPLDEPNEVPLANFAPGQIIYMVTDGKAGLPCRKGLLRTLLWLYLFKNAGFRDWNLFLEKFGIPFVLGKIPSVDFDKADKREVLLMSLKNLRSAGVGVGTTETEMQILNGASSGNQQAFELFQRYCDEIATMAILGQLGTSARSNGLSQGGAQDQVRQDILDSDCLMVQEAVNQQLIEHICRYVYGMADADDIEFVLNCEPPEDLNSLADRDVKIVQATGCRLSRKYAMEKYGVELEESSMPITQEQGEGQESGQQVKPRSNGSEEDNKNTTEDRRPFADRDGRTEDASMAIVRATLARMVDEEAFAAWRIPINDAIKTAFGDVDPEADDIQEQFAARVPTFLQMLPGVMDSFTADEIIRNLQGAMLAGFLNGVLPPSFWRKRS